MVYQRENILQMRFIHNIFIVLICLAHVAMASSDISHPKIGLVLSGGGAEVRHI